MVVMDEMTLRQEHTAFYRWSGKGVTPRVKTKRNPTTRVSFFGGLCLSDKKQVVHLTKKQNSTEMIEFLETIKKKYTEQIEIQLTKHIETIAKINEKKEEKEKIYKGLILICLDGAGFHRSKQLKRYLRDNYGIFELFRFPTYSPDLNPQEHVWKALRKHLSKVEGMYTFSEKVDRACRFLLTQKFDYKFV